MVSRRGLFRLSAAPALALAELSRSAKLPSLDEVFKGANRFEELLDHALNESWQDLPIGDLMGKVGSWLVGTPYVVRTLELDPNREMCSVDLLGLDCVTLFEDVLDFSRMFLLGGSSTQAMLDQIQFTRYRSGVLNGYVSRLHYTMDWIHDNVKKKVVRNMTAELPGAVAHKYSVDFMSKHPDDYIQLKTHPDWISQIRHYEEKISERHDWMLPMDHVAAAEQYLKTGDIVGVLEEIPGIDIGHTGMVYRDESGRVGFLNASSLPSQMKVTIGYPFHEAVNWNKRNVGIVVARPQTPIHKRSVATDPQKVQKH